MGKMNEAAVVAAELELASAEVLAPAAAEVWPAEGGATPALIQREDGEAIFMLTARSLLGGVVLVGEHKVAARPVTLEGLSREEVDAFWRHRADIAIEAWPAGWKPPTYRVTVRGRSCTVGAAGRAWTTTPETVDMDDVALADLWRARSTIFAIWPKEFIAPDGSQPWETEPPMPAAAEPAPLPKAPPGGWEVVVDVQWTLENHRRVVAVGGRVFAGRDSARVDDAMLRELVAARDAGRIRLELPDALAVLARPTARPQAA